MTTQIAKLRHQLEVAHTLAKSHIPFVVIPILEATDEPFLARLHTERLERLASMAEEEQKD